MLQWVNEMNAKVSPKIGVFSLTLINVIAIASLRDLPQMAIYGLGSIFFYAAATLFFFLPVSLVAAELATGWPERGGVYIWVREAFGPTWGFVAVFLQWFQNLCWYPVVITYAAASLAFGIAPTPEDAAVLAENRVFIVTAILVIFWSCVLSSLRGLRFSSGISVIGAFCGVLLPGIFLIGLAAVHLATGGTANLSLSFNDLLPDLEHPSNLTFGVSVFLAFAGMEMTAAHAREVNRPGRSYPLAIAIAAFIILLIFVLGALSIAVVIPASQIVLQTGVVMAIYDLLHPRGLDWMARTFAIMLAFGVVGSVSAWIVGPSKGILAAAEEGHLTPWFSQTNSFGVPVRILYIQGAVVTILCLAFVLQPTVAAGYFMLSDLTIQLYLVMYIMMFLAALRLRVIAPDRERQYRIPGGMLGISLVAGIGIVGAVFAIIVGFVPPAEFHHGAIDPYFFVIFLATGMVVFCILPFFLARLRKPN